MNIKTDYETQEDCTSGYSPDRGSNYVGFTRSRNCNDAMIKVSVRAKYDKKTFIYNGILEVNGSNGYQSQSGFSRPSGACLSTAGTIPMQATIHVPANIMYNGTLTNANIKLGHASASSFNRPKTFSWPLLQHPVIH